MPRPLLNFEGVIGYNTADAEEAAHFFEHTLGLQLTADDDGMRFYQLRDGTTLAVDATGRSAGERPYLLFSTPDIRAAADHFVERGCVTRELPWAQGAGFIAATPEGHTVAVVDESTLSGNADGA
jgi:predicted enzyme related to lactoylglutathione lyase